MPGVETIQWQTPSSVRNRHPPNTTQTGIWKLFYQESPAFPWCSDQWVELLCVFSWHWDRCSVLNSPGRLQRSRQPWGWAAWGSLAPKTVLPHHCCLCHLGSAGNAKLKASQHFQIATREHLRYLTSIPFPVTVAGVFIQTNDDWNTAGWRSSLWLLEHSGLRHRLRKERQKAPTPWSQLCCAILITLLSTIFRFNLMAPIDGWKQSAAEPNILRFLKIAKHREKI